MAKQLNVNLAFTADTSKAKAQLQDLQTQLTNLINKSSSSGSGLGINADIEKAAKSAAELQAHLNKAVNTKTGNLDFSKLNDSLKKSGKSLSDYGEDLRNIGPDGQKAFQALATSVANAEIPIRRSNAALTEMWTTLKNTARWQISSSILHGFMGAVQSAYGYAQDLNESLNNIRIVTGQNIDQMAKFADQANKAAKVLSTTTTEYTNASLIYYQQGLDEQQVQERADITIKMANVSRQSAEEVSDQMTAIWNNFYDGTQSLEHYADAMTKLGADTASSSDEIAQGLEKFAAIGDMIGLSFDNAAAALATVTATTRQSADVVGTAFKTIFARIQGLSLGETLDDGTTLNKYSEALSKVGISIFEQNGELKDMDSILAEMGDKWESLSKDQQVALAQTVAGVRQYNQLVALMDNYDFYEKNLASAQNADGSLQAQADIYAESWEAAQKRVQAASQAIYQDLLNDEAFIDILNAIEKILTGLDKFIDTIGGLGGVLTSLGAIVTKVFHNQMAQSLTNAAYSLKMMTAKGREEIKKERIDFLDNAANQTQKKDFATEDEKARNNSLRKQLELQAELIENADRMSDIEMETNKRLMDRVRLLGDLKEKAAVSLDQAKEKSSDATFDARVALTKKGQNEFKEIKDSNGNIATVEQQIQKVQQKFTSLQATLRKELNLKTNLPQELKKMQKEGASSAEILTKIKVQANQISDKELRKYVNGLKAADVEGDNLDNTLITLMAHLDGAYDDTVAAVKTLGLTEEQTDKLVQSMQERIDAQLKLNQITEEEAAAQKKALESIKGSKGAQQDWANHMVNIANTTMATISIIQTLGGVWDTVSDPDATPWEKVSAVMMGLATVVPMLTMALNKESIQSLAAASAAIAHALGLGVESTAASVAAGATTSFGAALWAVLWPIGLVVAAVALLVGGIMALVNAYNADANASKKAQEELNTANQALDDAKQKYQEVADAIKTYEESVDTLSKIRRGTEEWDDAVKSLNADVLELIKSYSGLAQYVTNEDGVLTISQEGLDWLEETQAKNVRTAEINSYNAQVRANKAESRSDTTDLSRDITALVPAGDTVYDAFDRNTTESVLNAIAENGNTIFADTKDSSAQDNLANALYGAGFDELTYAQQAVVDASIENSDKLMQLAADLEANSQANRILTEQIANSALADNSKYNAASDDAQNAVDQVVANALENVNDSAWSKTYLDSDGTAMNDKEIQAEYAKLMGWDTTNIGNKSGFGEYNLADGTTYKVDDTTARYALNQQRKLEELTGAGGTSDAAIQDFAELSADALDVDNMKEYLEYREDYYKIAQDTYNLTDEQVEKLLQESTAVGELAKSYDIASEMAAKFNGEEHPDDKYYEEMAKAMEGLSDEELTIALDVLADSTTLEEFQTKFEQACTEAMINSWNVSAETMKTVMDEGSKEGKFSDENMTALESDDGFIESLKEQGVSFKEFQLQTFDEQYAMVLRYYQDVSAASAEAYETQKGYLTQEKLDKEAQLNALRSAQKEYNQLILDGQDKQAEELAKEFEDTWDIEITTDITEAESELDLINDKLKDLKDKHIEIAIDWDGIDEIENGIKQTAEFTKLLKDETKKVGNSYQMTAAQAKDWMQVYPELFENATVTTDGLISLDESYVNEFINGKEAMSEASIEQKLLDLEAEEARLLAEKDSLQAEFDAVKAVKEGIMEIEELSAEQLSDLHSRLTQYYIDLGYDEAEAHAQALNDMGLDEETYSKLVANAAETNAKNQAKAAKEGADAQAQALSGLAGLWQKFVNGLKKVAQAVKRALSGEEVDQTFGEISPSVSVDDGSFSGYSMTEAFAGTDKSGILEAFDKGSFDSALDGITLDMSEIDAALASIKNQKTYLEALKNQELDDFNSTNPDDVDGTNKEGSDKKADIKDLTEILERYHEINEEIKMQERLIDRLAKAKDRAYGQDKIKLMEQEIEATKTMLAKQEQLYEAQTAFLAIDKAAVVEKFANATFDDYGNITNYTDLLSPYAEAINKAKRDYNASQSETDKELLEDAQKEYDKQVELLSKYEATLAAWHDQADVLTDLRNQIQDLNYEKLQEALNLKIEIDENSLRQLELILKRYEDNFFKMAEAAAILGNDKVNNAKSQLATYTGHKDALDADYKAGKISQADYMAGIKEVREGIYSQIEALIDLDNQMMHYYEDTLSAANEELSKYTGHMEHLTGVFDHYLSLMDILGKTKDYEAMGDFLGGKADTIKDRLDVAQSYYTVLLEQKEEAERKLNAAIAAGDDAAAELYKNEWDALVVAVDEAQEEILSLTEEWAEAMKAVIDNNMAKISDTLEKTLTKLPGMDEGFGFDYLMDSFDKLNTRQEEFLTKTNQIYEVNKLMRTANKALDETDNKAAKQKLQNFINETKSLQENTQLSKYELEIQQAKYDLLLAQIALEEAQNAKSTVRLSRDSEGNFGYVYTADQDKISDAEQRVDDAENALYNKSLDGQQNYTEKYLQAQQEMFNDLDELWRLYYEEGVISREEYERRYAEIQDHYYGSNGILTTYAHLYNVGVQADSRATADNWQTDYGNMTQNTETWAGAVNDYYTAVQGQITQWESLQTTANEQVSGALNNSETATKELTDESKNLKDTIETDVIPAIEEELKAVALQTAAYAAQRKELQGLIDDYIRYIEQLNSQVAVANVSFDKNTDYSALMNEYINNGGKTTDKAFQDMLAQRDAKIEWLSSAEGGNKGEEYWGTKGADTLALYQQLEQGKASPEEQAWFEKDYMTKDEMLSRMESLGISTDELEAAIGEVKTSTDIVSEKISETAEGIKTKLSETNESTKTKIGEAGEGIKTKLSETSENTKTKIGETGTSIIDGITGAKDDTVTTLGTINSTIETSTGTLVGAIGDAASTVASSVGGAISDIRSDVSSLESRVNSLSTSGSGGSSGGSGARAGAGSRNLTTVAMFDTGGYTGDWGPEGKQAILHEKELVLNQTDTANFLMGVSLLREIVSMIDLQAAYQSGGAISAPGVGDGHGDTLQQEVTIHAEFPNATNRTEIEEAFNNLVNRASQFANRKR